MYPPSTTNGGAVPAEPAHVPEPVVSPVHQAEPVEAAGAVEAAPIITPLEGETFQVSAAAQPVLPPKAATRRPLRCSAASDHLLSREMTVTAGAAALAIAADGVGRNQRWGRPDRGGRGGRDRRPGRDLPPSKYASPSDSRPREAQPYEAACRGF